MYMYLFKTGLKLMKPSIGNAVPLVYPNKKKALSVIKAREKLMFKHPDFPNYASANFGH